MGGSLCQRSVYGVRLAKCVIAVDAHESVDLAIDGIDALEARLHRLAGADFLGGKFGREASEGEFMQHHSTILGTTNRPLACLGALARAASCGIDGCTSSVRRTLASGTA